MLYQRNNSCITAIRNDCGDWIYDSESIEAEANKFFQNLYGESPGPMGCLPSSKLLVLIMMIFLFGEAGH